MLRKSIPGLGGYLEGAASSLLDFAYAGDTCVDK